MRGGRWSIYWGLQTVRRSFDFAGRSPRAEVGDYVGLLILCVLASTFLALLVGLFDTGRPDGIGRPALLLYAALLPLLGLLARRLNDQDRSRWWLLAWPLAFAWPLLQESGSSLAILPEGLREHSGIALLPLIILLCLPGTGAGHSGHDADPRPSGR